MIEFLGAFYALLPPSLSTPSISAFRRPSESSTFLSLSAPFALTYTHTFFSDAFTLVSFFLGVVRAISAFFVTGEIDSSCSLLLLKEVEPGMEIARILSLRNISLSSLLFFTSIVATLVRAEEKASFWVEAGGKLRSGCK